MLAASAVAAVCDDGAGQPRAFADVSAFLHRMSASRQPHRELSEVTTNGDDAASHSGGRGTNRSGGRDRRDGPTHAHGRL